MIITTIRIDAELYNKVADLANHEERSTNSQIVYILKTYMENLEQNEKN